MTNHPSNGCKTVNTDGTITLRCRYDSETGSCVICGRNISESCHTKPLNEGWSKDVTAILEEFTGRVKYYELPKDMAVWTYKENDMERARRQILELLATERERVLEKIESIDISKETTGGFRRKVIGVIKAE